MLILGILAVLLLCAPALGVLPPLKRGPAFNTLFHVAMPGREVYGPAHEAVLAQELVEWWAAWAVALLLSAPLVWLLPAPFDLAAPAIAMIAWRWRMTAWGTRQLEYLGWAAEWLHGQRTAPAACPDLAAHARELRRGYLVFAEASDGEVLAALGRRMIPARILLIVVGARLRRLSAPLAAPLAGSAPK